MSFTPQRWSWNHRAVVPQAGAARPELWLAALVDADTHRDELLETLSPEECSRCARMQREDDRTRFVLGRAILRELLGRRLGLALAAVGFACNEFGKPRLASSDPGAPRFNVSHSGEWVLVAISPRREIGVDIEQERPEPEWAEVAPGVLGADALRRWPSLLTTERRAAFFQAWTTREAILKAAGVGLAAGVMLPAERNYEVTALDLPSGYRGAVALGR